MTLARFVAVSLSPLPLLLATTSAQAQPSNAPSDDQALFPYEEPAAAPIVRQPEAQKAPVAPEPPSPRFGERGEIVLTASSGGANGAGISYAQYSGSLATYLSGSFEVGLDYFLVSHFSLGFDVSAGFANNTGYGADSSLVQTKSTSVSGGLRFGADLPLGDTFSFYPRLTLGVLDSHRSESLVSGQSLSVAGSAVGSPETSQVGPWMNLYAPLLVHPTSHFFFGAGPRLAHTFANTTGAAPGVSGQPTTLGASFVIGGWWGGDEAAPSTPIAAPASGLRERRFGDQGTFVITSETSGYALSATYAGTNASSLSVYVSPGFDYFVADHVSIGVDLWGSYGNTVGFDASGAKVTQSSTSFGLAPRFGVDVPVSDSVSWYPRAEIGAGPIVQNESSNGASNDHTSMRVFVSAEAPILFHAARHFFAGAGPTVYHDLSQVDQNGTSNAGTQFGASVLVGGWL